MKKNTLLLNENDVIKKYNILFSFVYEDDNYIVYTDEVKNEDGFIKTYAGKYTEFAGECRLLPVSNERVLEYIEVLIKKISGE